MIASQITINPIFCSFTGLLLLVISKFCFLPIIQKVTKSLYQKNSHEQPTNRPYYPKNSHEQSINSLYYPINSNEQSINSLYYPINSNEQSNKKYDIYHTYGILISYGILILIIITIYTSYYFIGNFSYLGRRYTETAILKRQQSINLQSVYAALRYNIVEQKALLGIDPSNASAWNKLAKLYQLLGEEKLSEEAYANYILNTK